MSKDWISGVEKTAWGVQEQVDVAFKRKEKLHLMEIIIVLLGKDRRVRN